jgi:hypothetical protein
MQSLIAWLVLPALLLALCGGLGQLVQRLTSTSLPPGLGMPVGAALAITLALSGYVIGLRGLLTPLLLAVLAIAGLVLAARAGARPRRPGLPALVWAVTYGLYIAPVVLSGHWTWPGYNFVNDTSVQLLLAEWLPEHGRMMPPEPLVSTPLDVLRTYISGGYPLGSHALLAVAGGLIPVPLEALYQPFIAAFAGLAAMALLALARPLVGERWAAFGAVAAMASNLLYQYALQGNMKELVTVTSLATAAAVAGWSIGALKAAEPGQRRGLLIRAAIVLALPVAAAVNVLSTAGGPYAALIVLAWLAMLLIGRVVPGPPALARALAAGGAVLVVATAAQLSTLISFGEATSTTYASAGMITELGHLARPLEIRQAVGIWLIPDYRLPPIGLKATLTTAIIWLALALGLIGGIYAIVRRRLGVLAFAVPLVVIMIVVTPRVSPYADAKTYMLMAPGITLMAAVGAAAVGRLRPLVGIAAAVVLAAGVVGSDALAYHGVQLAPADRMEALHDLDERYAGQGLILFNEPEEFAKNFLAKTKLDVGAESITPSQTQLRAPQAFAYLWFDLDDITLEWQSQFPLMILRRSPAASRPPANYELDYTNRYYEVWKRRPGPKVLEHLPIQGLFTVSGDPQCEQVVELAARARRGEKLVAATAPPSVRLDPATAEEKPSSWRPHPFRAGMVLTGGPGTARQRVTVEQPGRYRGWIAGSFGRAITGAVDGREIGSAQGVNTVGQWHEIGEVELSKGAHELSMTRPDGSLAPGSGYAGELGPMVLQRVQPRRLVEVAPRDAERDLCNRPWDWIERISVRG